MKKNLIKAKEILTNGGVIAIPTETVYGLAANAFDPQAVSKIFKIKGRPLFNPLIVHIKSIESIHQVAQDIPEIAMELANRFWPGPLTLVLPKKECVPNIVTSGKTTVAVRVPAHEVTLELLQQLDFPLAAPSANPFGYISPTTSAHVKNQLGNKIEFILEGGSCKKGIESTIIGFENGQPLLYRVGAISQEEIESFVGKITLKNNAAASPEAPGMLSKHYSPKTKFIVSDTITKSIKRYENQRAGFLLFSNTSKEFQSNDSIRLTNIEDLNEAAQNLYAAMHELDARDLEVIIAEKFPNLGLGISLNDRLQRAQETSF